MANFHLTQNQLSQLIFDNCQKTKPNNLACYCLDNYLEKNLKTSLVIPGGDLGQIAILLAAANSFGFEIDKDQLLMRYFQFLNGKKNFYLEDHCQYFHLIKNQPEKFQLNKTDLEFLKVVDKQIKKNPSLPVFQKENQPNGIIIIKGEGTIPSRSYLKIKTIEGEKTIEVFLLVFHQTLFEERQKNLSKKLSQEKIVKLYPGLEEEYLKMALIETGENHFYEYINYYTKNLPLYQVNFHPGLKFEINNLGRTIDN